MPSFTLDTRPDGIAVLTFDFPQEKVNKLSTPALDELDRLLDRLAVDQQTRALIVTSGKPGMFIAGADIAEIRDITDAARGEELSRRGQSVMNKLEALPFPTIAAIQGACMGGGLELALSCSLRVASCHAKTILGLPEVKIGIIPGFGGTQRLPRVIGLVHSLDMIVTGKSVEAKKAKQIGLIDEMTSPEALLDTAMRMAMQAAVSARPSGIRANRPLHVILRERIPLTRALIYRTAQRRVDTDRLGNYPAPLAALEAVRYGHTHGLSAGYENETKVFGRLSSSVVSKNLINVFYLHETLKKNIRPSPFAIVRAVIIGAGGTDRGIAQLFAENGIAIETKDWTPNASAGRSGSAEALDFAGVDLAVEAVVENMDVKKNVLNEFEQASHERAIFASNTSSLSITELATASNRPGQVVGMHFFNPVEKMPLVEVVRGKQTSPETVAAVAALSRKLGKLPVVVNDGPGFLVNRILMPYLGESLRMMEEGTGIEEIDSALLGFGMPMGAFILLDEIGIDIAHKVSGILRAGLGDRIRPSALLESLYKEGFLGKKNGKGFYQYAQGKRGAVNPVVSSRITVRKEAAGRITEKEIVERAVFLMIKEAALCLGEGIIDRPDLLDAALIFGIGFPPFRGGLLRYAESLGAKYIVERLDAYTAQYGDRFKPPQSLFEMSRDDLIGQVVG